MDDDLIKGFRKAARRRPDEEKTLAVALEVEWVGTGLCPQAQADGVPCYEAGRPCDQCARATPANLAR